MSRRTLVRVKAYAIALALVTAMAGLGGAAPASAQDSSGKLLMVLDSSGSMAEPTDSGQPKIDAAKAALTDVAGSLDPKAQVGMRVYGATVFDKSDAGACSDSQLVVPIGAGNSDALKSEIAKYKPYGETPIAYALEQAGNDLGASGQRSILLVSDGEETCTPDPCPAAEKLAARGVDLRIDVIGFKVGDTARKQLSCIADKGRGQYSDADNAEELKKKLTEAKDRAIKPFETTGTPVAGAADRASAARVAVGSWTDTLPAEKASKFYRIRRATPGSTVWVGVNAQTHDSRNLLVASLTPADDENTDCGRQGNSQIGESTLLTAMTTTAVSQDEKCTSGDLILELEQSKGAGQENLQLNISEEPPVPDPSGLPEAVDEPTWQPLELGTDPQPRTGGQSLAGAAPVEKGQTYRLEIVPGETQVFKVRADWGQQVQLRGHTDGPQAEYLGNRHALRTQILSPWGGEADALPPTGQAPGSAAPSAYDGELAAVTRPVRWNNRSARFNQSSLGTSVAGEYYVALSLEKKGGTTAAVPVTFVIDTPGQAGSGAPTYEGEVAPEDPNSGQQTGPEQAPGGEEAGSMSPLRIAGIGGGVVGGLALIGAAIWLVVRRRR